MAYRDPLSTKNKILDAAEVIYATDGVEGLTLRVITERAGVNLASVNYHFGTKESLTHSMMMRLLVPLHDERIGLLVQLEDAMADHLHPTDVIAAILLPLMREIIREGQEPHRIAFYLKCTSDPSPLIRTFMATQFQEVSQRFDEAFVKASPRLSPHEALWRARLFFNALPGTVANQNTGTMLSELLLRPGITVKDILIHFGSVLECVTGGGPDSAKIESIAYRILAILSETRTVRELRTKFPLTPEDARSSARFPSTMDESLSAVQRPA